MTENTSEVIESIKPSPVGRALIYGLIGAAIGIALGYGVAKILEEERFGRYRAEDEANETAWVDDEPAAAVIEETEPEPVEEPTTAEAD